MKFTPQDFATEYGDLLAREAADIANAKLQEWLDKAPTVFRHHVGWFQRDQVIGDHPRDGDTHKAKLVCIETISNLERGGSK